VKISLLLAFFLGLQVALSVAEETFSNWPHWRGPIGTGESPDAQPPIEWSEEKNIAWKLPLPGIGHSSPVVWGDIIFLTASHPVGEPFPPRPDLAPGAHNNKLVDSKWRFVVLAVNRKDGSILWEKTVREAIPTEGGHETGTHASASPVTDGERVYAFFGSRGLYCLDAETGESLWDVDFGDMKTKHGHGEGSSPVLKGDGIYVVWDHEGLSFLAALDKNTGKKLWRQPRNERTSWSSPIAIEVDGQPQIIAAATERIRAYHPKTGDVIWECGGLSDNVVATPVFSKKHDILLATSSYNFQSMLAMNVKGAAGDITDSDRILWTQKKRTPYIPSPLLFQDHVYFLGHYQGVLSRVHIQSGEAPSGPFRIDGLYDIYASPVAANDHIYLVDRSGIVVVLSGGTTPEPVAVNQLDDRFSATPALVGKDLILRGEKFLYGIREPTP